MNIFLSLVASYLLGSLPTAYLFGKWLKGIDIRRHGSGNVGATNAFRVLGKGVGTVVLLVDILKGVAATTLVGHVFHLPEDQTLLWIALGVTVVAGHNWTIFLQFKGGKGIAASLGVLIGLTIQFPMLRPVLFSCIAGWAVVFLVSGYVSLASLAAAVLLPVTMWLTHQPRELSALGMVFCFFIVYRHRTNMGRLLSGTESRVPFPFNRRKEKA